MATVPAKGNLLSNLAVLIAAGNATAGDNADTLVSMAHTAYRVGQFSAAAQLLQKAGNAYAEKGNYLNALIALEKGETAAFENCPIEANYFKALDFVKKNNSAAAIAACDELLSKRPGAIRPRLLRAYLKRDIGDACEALALDPGSIEVWATLKELGYAGASERLQHLLRQHAMAAVAMNDFLKEIKQGIWRHSRRFEYDTAWFENAGFPPFPDSLKYSGY
jgi:tetratricopeptide (TPR) repeat protein